MVTQRKETYFWRQLVVSATMTIDHTDNGVPYNTVPISECGGFKNIHILRKKKDSY